MTDRDLVIVTGTSAGLGAAIARRLISDGMMVVGISRRPVTADSLGVASDDYVHYEYDFADVNGIGALVQNVCNEVARPYGLVNNAALGTDGLLLTMHNSEIERLSTVNVVSPMVLTKYVVRHMVSARRGRVVNISSIVARTGYRGLAPYGATKAALEGFTRSLARDVGKRGVTVNAVAPGFMETDMTSALGAENLLRIRKRSALERFADPAEVAAGVSYLIGPDAAAVTGTVLTIDGGSTA